MKSTRINLNRSFRAGRLAVRLLAVVIALLALDNTIYAQSGTWTNLLGGSWAAATNWNGGIIATDTDNTADFSTLTLGAAEGVTLDGKRTIGNLTLGDVGDTYGWTLNTGSGGPLTLGVSSGSPTITVTGSRLNTIGLVLAGTKGMTKAGTGNLKLTSANTYSGGTTLNSGYLAVGNITSLGASSNPLTLNGGTLYLQIGTANVSPNYNTTVGGNVNIVPDRASSGAGLIYTMGTLNVTGLYTLEVAPAAIGSLATGLSRVLFGNTSFTSGTVFEVESSGTTKTVLLQLGALQNNGDLTFLCNDGFDTIRLAGTANPARTSGTVTIDMNGILPLNNGLLQVSGLSTVSNYFGSASVALNFKSGQLLLIQDTPLLAHNVTVSGDFAIIGGRSAGSVGQTNAFGMLSIGGNTLTVNNQDASAVSGTSMIAFGDTTLTGSPTFNVNNGVTVPTRTVLNFYGAVGDGGAGYTLTKSGTGTLLLSGTNTYNGPTTINAGTLLVNGSVQNGTVTVASGATLGGTGVINGPVSVTSGSVVAPGGTSGASVGTLTISNNFTPGSCTINSDLNTATTVGSGVNDLIQVGGDLDLSQGTATIVVNPMAPLQLNTPYTIMTYSGSLIGNASGLSVPPFGRNFNAGVVSTATPGVVEVTFTTNGVVVPNPLVWKGYVSSNWDENTTLNWSNNVTDNADVFINGDNVLLDDTSSMTNLNLIGLLGPASTTVSNSVNAYTISGSGSITSGSLLKQGTNTLTINSPNSYSGSTTISAGKLVAGTIAALGSPTSPLVLNSGTTLDLAYGTLSDYAPIHDTTVNGVATILADRSGAGGTLYHVLGDLNITTPTTLTVKPGKNVTSGQILLTMGGTTVSSGTTFEVESNGVGGTVVLQLGALQNSGDFTIQSLDGWGAFRLTTNANSARTSGTVTINMGKNGFFYAGAYCQLTSTTGTDSNYFGTTGVSLQLNSGSLYMLNGVSIAPYNTTVGGNFLFQLGNYTNNSAGITNTFGNLAIGSNTLSVINVDGATTSGSSVLAFGATTLTGSPTFNVNNGVIPVVLALGAVSDGGAGYSLTTIGTGKLLLTNSNTYTGGTTVSNGVLEVNNTTGSGLGSGAVIVNAGATLAGSGSVNTLTNTVTNNGTIAVGNLGRTSGSSLTLTNTGGLTINSGGMVTVSLFSGAGAGDNSGTASAADVLNAQCPVTISSGAVLTINNPNGLVPQGGDKWKIANWQSTPMGTFDTLNLPALTGDNTWDTTQLYTSGTIAVGSAPTKSAQILGATVSNGSLILYGTNNNVPNTSFHYEVLSSTNLTLSLTNWTVLATNAFNANGTFSYTNVISPVTPVRFFDTIAVP